MTPSTRFAVVVTALAALSLFGCPDSASKRTQDQLDALQKKKAAAAKADDKPEPLPAEVLHFDPPYDDTQAVVILPDGPCPEGFWALFPGDAPGATPEEKKANAANRKSLADGLRAKKFLVKMKGSSVTLSPYDAPKGRFTIDVKGTIDCTDSMGHVAIAWTEAKAGDPGIVKMNHPFDIFKANTMAIIGLLLILVIFVTMVYGPIAAMLVELFPTKIRYTSMSLPYHIGNGWFGGMLPLLATALVAASGDIYYGLWYPIIVALMTFVIGLIFLKDRKDIDLHADESAYR